MVFCLLVVYLVSER
ncbi:hypothetical protein Hamer_G023682 [Homarus americanus]|uniref:Uncharacterized protein n=1 Tax=Homarus americanus TaxID=6706 RepID=A0A8J5JF67_HOMAM|nr:hypothetical protein Hamer_G023682 [Homarus americanus]